MSPILLATDFSVAAEAALRYAVDLARRYPSKLYVVHVIPTVLHQFRPPKPLLMPYEDALREAKQRMHEVAARLQGLPHEAIVLAGEVPEVLSEFVRKHEVRLLVLGTRGRRGLRRFMLGSVAEEIFRLAPCAVLTVGPKAGDVNPASAGSERILFPTDFTPDSLSALPHALALAREQQQKLMLLHVAPHSMRVLSTSAREYLVHKLRSLVPLADIPDAGLKCIVRFGSPEKTILRVATERKSTLIVLGVRGGGPYTRAATHLPGPTAYAIVARAPCPVLTLHAGQPASASAERKPQTEQEVTEHALDPAC